MICMCKRGLTQLASKLATMANNLNQAGATSAANLAAALTPSAVAALNAKAGATAAGAAKAAAAGNMGLAAAASGGLNAKAIGKLQAAAAFNATMKSQMNVDMAAKGAATAMAQLTQSMGANGFADALAQIPMGDVPKMAQLATAAKALTGFKAATGVDPLSPLASLALNHKAHTHAAALASGDVKVGVMPKATAAAALSGLAKASTKAAMAASAKGATAASMAAAAKAAAKVAGQAAAAASGAAAGQALVPPAAVMAAPLVGGLAGKAMIAAKNGFGADITTKGGMAQLANAAATMGENLKQIPAELAKMVKPEPAKALGKLLDGAAAVKKATKVDMTAAGAAKSLEQASATMKTNGVKNMPDNLKNAVGSMLKTKPPDLDKVAEEAEKAAEKLAKDAANALKGLDDAAVKAAHDAARKAEALKDAAKKLAEGLKNGGLNQIADTFPPPHEAAAKLAGLVGKAASAMGANLISNGKCMPTCPVSGGGCRMTA